MPDGANVRLLFVTNFFPPAAFGGYEEMCRDLAEYLRERGHDVAVLTSRHRRAEIGPDTPWVHRRLHLEMIDRPLINAVRIWATPLLAARNRRIAEQLLVDHDPDVVVVWGMWNLGLGLASYLENRRPASTVFCIADYWPTLPAQVTNYWSSPARSALARPLKGLLAFLWNVGYRAAEPPKLRSAIFPSRFMYEAVAKRFAPGAAWSVIPGPIDLRPFAAVASSRRQRGERLWELGFAGRLTPEKGVETAIRAIAAVRSRPNPAAVRLTVAGDGESAYVDRLRSLVSDLGLADHVRFAGRLDKQGVAKLYAFTDIQLFPSTWDEPFGRVMIEAMASGTAVVGTATGGAAEILEAGRNSLVHRPDDAQGLADAIETLIADDHLREAIVAAGRNDASRRWSLETVGVRFEEALQRAAGAGA